MKKTYMMVKLNDAQHSTLIALITYIILMNERKGTVDRILQADLYKRLVEKIQKAFHKNFLEEEIWFVQLTVAEWNGVLPMVKWCASEQEKRHHINAYQRYLNLYEAVFKAESRKKKED